MEVVWLYTLAGPAVWVFIFRLTEFVRFHVQVTYSLSLSLSLALCLCVWACVFILYIEYKYTCISGIIKPQPIPA